VWGGLNNPPRWSIMFKRIFHFINDIFNEKTVNDSLSITKYEEIRKFLVDLDISVKDIENP
jgi:hypothetical protein